MPAAALRTVYPMRWQTLAILSGLWVTAFALPVVVAWREAEWLRLHFDDWWWLIPAAIFLMLSAMALSAYLGITRRLSLQLFKRQQRYHRTLIAASSGMTRVKDLERLCRLTAHVVNRTVRLAYTGVFLYDPTAKRYDLRAVRNQRMLPSEMTVERADALVQLLESDRSLLLIDDVRASLERSRGTPLGEQLAEIHTWMGRIEARMVVPSFSNNKLLAFLVLGAKRSGEDYTMDDIAVFSGLANQAALAIENAQFFEELRSNEAYMIQSEKLASLGQLASGMAHEIHNPLTIISGEAQLYLEQFKGRDSMVDKIMVSIVEECHRAADITRRILRFAKPAPPDFHQVNLRAAVQESLTLAGYQVRMDKVRRTVSLPESLPPVRGNLNQLQEVVLNLILNACQAMGESGGRLNLAAKTSNGMVELTVADTGPGIPLSKLNKVFDPFFTTKHTGTGLGLFVTQRIVQSHGGTIEVASTEGEGTTFTIRLPVAS
ncbi:MAG TPA: ATP-binding protein [bacterium]